MASKETMVAVDGEEVRISSPDRVVFPDRGWTKLDIASHFVAIAEGCIRGVFGRPTMMKRYMKSVDVPPIYNKRATKQTPFETAMIRFPSQRSGRMNVPRTQADIVRFIQLGCLDFHPWPVRAEDIDHPDELRFDFDPTEGFGFSQVKEAALASKELLDEVGLVGWPKTSGSRGIHMYVRIEPIWDFFQTRRAVLAFGRELERRHPGLITTKWWKEERTGIFIDYNQNARDKTVSSAYGVRPTGYVSAPLTWDEVPDVEIEDFPMSTYADRYAAVGDLTAGMNEAVGRIDTLMEWVVRDEENGQGEAPWPPQVPQDARRAAPRATKQNGQKELGMSRPTPDTRLAQPAKQHHQTQRAAPGATKQNGQKELGMIRPTPDTRLAQPAKQHHQTERAAPRWEEAAPRTRRRAAPLR